MNSSTESENQITQLEQENELLLLQLHQVQEELERYFLLYQDSEAKNQASRELPMPEVFQANVKSLQHRPKQSQLFVEKLPKNVARVLKRTTPGKWLILRESEFFDEAWYLQTYPDVAEKRKDPVVHYLRHGAKEGRNPSPQFDTEWYLANYRDVAEKGVNPLWHYIQFGQYEGRLPRRGGIQPPPDPFENERRRLKQALNEQARTASERHYRIEQLTQTNEAANRQIKEQEDSIKNLIEARDRSTQQLSELQAEIQQLAQARGDQIQLASERLEEIEQLTALKAEAERQVYEHQSRIVALTEEKLELELLAAGRLQQIEQLTAAKVEAERQSHENQNRIAILTNEKNEQIKLAEDRLQRIKQMETELADTQVRQTLLNEEMIKAEAQIDFIKELLLEDKIV